MINFHSLRSFYACAETLNFSRAAERLGITQPSLSQQIKNLEESLGFELFVRKGRSIRLSSRGTELFETSHDFFELNRHIEKCIGRLSPPDMTRALNVFVSDQIDRPFVAEAVSHWARAEKARISILSHPLSDLLKRAKKESCDLLISHEKLPISWAHCEARYPVFLVTARKKTARIDRFADPRQMLDYLGDDLIVPSLDTRLGQEFEKFRRTHRLGTRTVLESNIVSCLVRSTVEGAGSCFLPLPYIKSSLFESKLDVYGPPEGYWTHSLHFYADVKKRDLERHPLIQRFRRLGARDN